MSLFASAFDSGASAGSSSRALPYIDSAKPAKRKRPSSKGEAGDHQLRATQANLERLISKVEKGVVRDKKDGKEAMGLEGSAKKPKKRRKEMKLPPSLSTPKLESLRDTSKNHEVTGKGNGSQLGRPEHGRKGRKGEKTRPVTNGVKATLEPVKPGKHAEPTPKPAPAELPLPHKIASSTMKIQEGPKGEEGLTDMQKKMQAKLEEARFR